MPESTVKCQACGKEFQAKRATARFCGGTCRKQAHRARPTPKEASLNSMTERIIAEMDLDREAARKVVDEVLAEFRFLLPKQLTQYLENYVDAVGYAMSERMRRFLAEQKRDSLLELNDAQRETDSLRQRLFDKEVEIENLRTYNRGLNTRLRNLEVLASLDPEAIDWATLSAFDDVQLRQWVKVGQRRSDNGDGVNSPKKPAHPAKVKVGQRRSDNGDDQAAAEAMRWVAGNRAPAAALSDGQ